MKQRFLSLVLPVMTCFGLAATAQATVRIEPVISVDTAYDSNFWLSENDEMSVQTYSIKPGVKLNYEAGKTNIDASFILESYWYHDNDDRPAGVADASDDDYIGYTGRFSGSTKVTDRITLGLDDNIFYTRDPAQADRYSDSVSREKYILNDFVPNAYYDFGNKFGIDVAYANVYIDYQEDGEDSVQNGGHFNLYYNLNSKAKVFLSYDVWALDYKQDTSDYISNRVKLNYSHQFNYFYVVGGAGYHHRSFDQDYESLDLFSWNVSIVGQDPPAPEADPRAHMMVSLSQDMNDQGAGNSYYTATRLDAEFGYLFVEKIDTVLKGYFQNSDYETSDRDDDTYSVSAQVGYKFFKHGMVSLEIGHTSRDSSEDGLSYDDDFAMLSLDFGLDLSF